MSSIVVISDIATTQKILSSPIGTFDRSADVQKSFGQIIPSALLTLPTNDTYKHHRRIIGTAMTTKYIARATPKAYQSAKELVKLWKAKRDRTERAFEAEGDLQAATMVSTSLNQYKLTCRMLFVCFAINLANERES